uniref:catechol O-methyltransferase n=1 Tax=Haplomitrium mnioides TaxID=56921 RepID=A0A4D6TIC0_9MARC|nr:O-methyltransferase [Haplomitrium mnioides]
MAPEIISRTFSFISAMVNSSTRKLGQAGDGREQALLKHVLEVAEKNPQSVLNTIDKYAQRTWLMNIGDDKGTILDTALTKCNPKTVLELGAYCGYSAVRIASQLPPGSKLISVEMSPQNVSIARQIVEHAGLSSKVTVIEGILSTKVEEVKTQLHAANAKFFDFVFIDHDKNCYLPDVLLLKEQGMIEKGTVLFADNMKIPGSPKYRSYLKAHSNEFETVEHNCSFEYLKFLPDSVVISTCK